ncbi:efflux RND transporter permease subunit [Maridesulfovibrio ferrireducens]|uniref:efflux RND transporter permease subunit n=1 Tax=Maridesulfovibrio ferrireducens TaxID=246191 RepID=UPI001A261563|nr:efflux RND transporter permease subunit [Maridesulfovibrio ferrireducens]MBI9111185.1 efflux RND transporter permease subunit [Maridesulfovibrio ferrireducens]
MKGLMRFTLKQTVFINIIFILLMVVGLFCAYDLPVERYPNVHMGKVVITGFLPGASPADVEALVTKKIEDALDDLENVEYIRSRSFRERSSVLVKFIDDTDYKTSYDELRFRVLSIQNDLPKEMDPPSFMEINVSEWLPVIRVCLVGDRANRALAMMADEMKVPLRKITGVNQVKIEGEYVREFHVNLDPEKLIRTKITFEDAARALEDANISIPAGDFVSNTGEYVIVVDERFRTREEIAETIIRMDGDGSFVTIGDVMSDARVSYRDPQVITSINGQSAVTLKIVKTRDGNAVTIAEEVEVVVASFKEALEREGVKLVLTNDQRLHIDEAMKTLGLNLLVGIGLVFVVIYLVMGFRNAMLTTIGVPFAFLVTMTIMHLTGNSLNQITLFSFVLVSGIIVDDAIVVVENIFRHVQEGKNLRDAVVDGISEVFWPVISATATTIAAFLPMLIMSGSTGEFFAQVPKAVTFALIASLIECLVILPSHFLDWPGAKKLSKGNDKLAHEPVFMRPLRRWTDKLLSLVMRFRFTSLSVVFAAFVLAIFILGVSVSGAIPLIKIKFFPDDYSLYYIEMEGPVATPIEITSDKLKRMSVYIEKMGPGMSKSATAFAGFYQNEDYEMVHGSNLGNIVIELPAKNKQVFADAPENDPGTHLEFIRKEIEKFGEEGWTLRVRPEKDGPPTGKDLNIRVLGADHGAVQGLTKVILDFIKGNEELGPELVNLGKDDGTPNRIFRFLPINERVAEYGLTPKQVARLSGSVLDGRFVGEFRLADEDVDLRLKIDPEFLTSPEDALSIPVLEHHESPLRLGDLCKASIYMEPGQFNRFMSQRAVTITANIKPGSRLSSPTAVNRIKKFYESVRGDFPGASINFSGEFESTRKSYTSLIYAFFTAILIIYLILATQFQSYLQPVIILSAVVFSLTGVILGSFLSQTIFTVNSFIATVGVTGIVVNDSLVLLDFINKLYQAGLSRKEALREGVRIRLRPILLTTLTTTLGLLPMAIGFPSYSLVWGAMASTFVTGLCTATFLTLFIIPVEWDLLMGFMEWKEKRKERKQSLQS